MRDTQSNVIEAFYSSGRITMALMDLHDVLRGTIDRKVYAEVLKHLAMATTSNLNLQLVLAEMGCESQRNAVGKAMKS